MAIFGTYVGNNLVLTAPKYGGRLYCQADDIYITPLVVCHGVHEGALTNWITKHIKPGMTCVDLGANVGYFTVLLGYAVGSSGRVIAVEPVPSTMDILLQNIEANYLGKQVTAVLAAASRLNGSANFYHPKSKESAGSLRTDISYFQDVELTEVKTLVYNLNTLAADDEHIDFIKIDVEGNEFDVFMGAYVAFEKADVVAFEVNKSVLGKTYWPLMDTVREYIDKGWTLAIPSPTGDEVQVPLDWLLEQEFVSSALLKAPCAD